MKLKLQFVLFISILSAFNLSAQNTTTSSGSWDAGTNWTSGIPSSNEAVVVSHNMILNTDLLLRNGGDYIMNSPLIDPAGGTEYGITIEGNGNFEANANVNIGGDLNLSHSATLIIRSFDTLTVRGDANFKHTSEMSIETDGVLIIEGNMDLKQQNSNTVNGKIYVKGNITANQNATIDGTGNVEAEGDVDLNNGTTFFGSSSGCTSGCEYGSGAGLPIELKSFEAKIHPFNKNLVEIKWTTLTEINNQLFVIEHSTDGKHFEAVNQVEGAGNSNRELSYNLLVNIENNASQHYFRLKQIDYDGSSKTFNAVALKQSSDNSFEPNHSLEVYPNPSNGENLKLSMRNFEAGVYDLVLMNSNGQMIVNNSINLQDGASERSIDLLNGLQLSKGIYFVRMLYKEEQITKKIIVN
ncbi:MAG: T9SS type A sorting domain-containing protein [Vicingaceae bacterium]